MINICLSFQMYSEKTWPSCGHGSTSLRLPPCQSHFTTCSTSVTHTHTHECTLPLTHTERPSSPCSEMNEFAAVLNHFNHFTGKCLIHSYRSHTALELSHVYTFLHSPVTPSSHRHTHTHNDCLSLIVPSPVILEHYPHRLSLSSDNKLPNDNDI